MRVTERDEFGHADIVGVGSADLQLNLEFDEFNRVTDALDKLAKYEDIEDDPALVISITRIYIVIDAVKSAVTMSEAGSLGSIFDKGFLTACDAILTRIEKLAGMRE